MSDYEITLETPANRESWVVRYKGGSRLGSAPTYAKALGISRWHKRIQNAKEKR